MEPRRQERVNELLRDLLAEIVARELKDPRLEVTLLSITEVRVSGDLGHARVGVSVLGSHAEWEDVVAALNHGGPYIRRLLKPRLAWRRIPALHFEADDRMARGQEVLELMQRLEHERGAGAPSPDGSDPASQPRER